MNTNWERSRRSWLARNRLALISAAAIAAYAIFVEWVWGWPVLLRQWAEIGVGPVLSALALLVATYFIRCYRSTTTSRVKPGAVFCLSSG